MQISGATSDFNGGSGYTKPDEWVNIAKTGGLLCEMKFIGETTASPSVINAVEFIYNNWTDDPEHFGSYYANYSVMKGLRLLDIETIHPINGHSGFDWYGDPVAGYAQTLINLQQSSGDWPMGQWSSHPLSSAWAILALRKTVVQPGPTADAGSDILSHPPLLEILFDGTGSYHSDPAHSIVQYVWDFGDGSPTIEGPIVTHTFPAILNTDGTINWNETVQDYIVTLTVIDDNSPSQTDSDTLTTHITPPPWPPVADANGPYGAYPCQNITLDGSDSYDPNGLLYPDTNHPWHGEIVSWEWDLDNDGVYNDATGEKITWSNCTPSLYVVGLKVTNTFFESNEQDSIITIEEQTYIPASIDIKPGSDPNCFNLNERGVIPVAIFGSPEFDVNDIDLDTLSLQGLTVKITERNNKYLSHYEYINDDGYIDLIIKFEDNDKWFYTGNVSATLIGELYDGSLFEGTDSICIVP